MWYFRLKRSQFYYLDSMKHGQDWSKANFESIWVALGLKTEVGILQFSTKIEENSIFFKIKDFFEENRFSS